MPESVNQRTNAMSDPQSARQMREALEAARLDIGLLRTALLALGTKLDADVGVTDTNYNATLTTNLGARQLTP